MFDSPEKLLLGLVSGVVFGFLLHKGRVARFDVIVAQLLLKDWTVVKIMATAVAVGAVGVHLLVAAGIATLHVKPALLGGLIVGGLLFGLGLALYGYCPGTGVAASGAGHRDAAVGVAGMLSGALLFVLGYPLWKPVIESVADWGELTLPEASSSSTWLWVAIVTGALSLLLLWLRKRQSALPSPAAG
ncbi:YeeE/YedE thiosulfate transporter family protein [Piscinibacter sakaiensis]|uniref:YeeE/YedE thiosulfate transporter family protein n=1 Tax=Piscinibacter sakaiensis TaxID=1547922 RepID=UPI003AAB6BBC